MRSFHCVLFILAILARGSNAQISQIINDYDIEIMGYEKMIVGFRPFTGTFEFNSVPTPLNLTTVKYTFEVVDFIRAYSLEGDWIIRFEYNVKNMRLFGDSIIHWDGTHKAGDRFTGEIKLIPLTSGYYGFKVGLLNFNKHTKLEVIWCLDENGQLSFLGNPENHNVQCYPIRTTFFDIDSVRIIQPPINSPPRNHSFNYSITVNPPFTLGDTSIISYRLRAVEEMKNGFDIMLMVRNTDILSYPNKIDYHISKGEIMVN